MKLEILNRDWSVTTINDYSGSAPQVFTAGPSGSRPAVLVEDVIGVRLTDESGHTITFTGGLLG